MSPAGTMIMIAGIAITGAIILVRAIYYLHKRTRRMKVIPSEKNLDAIGDGALLHHPRSAPVRDIEPRGA